MMFHAAWKVVLAVALRVLVPVILIFISAIATARAQALPTATTTTPNIAISTSFDADSLGNRSIYLDSTFAPFGSIYETGMRFRATGNANWYRFLTSEDPRISAKGRNLEGGLLAGYAFSWERFRITGLVGPAFGQIVNQGVMIDRWGAKAVLDVYATPTDRTMASGSVSYSTITNYFQVEAKTGLKIFDDIYFGPETRFTWQQILPWDTNFSTNISTMRLGAHISGLSVGPAQIGISAGWAHDRQLGSGYYGGVNLYLPF
jgi:Cellulose biosynthesis protein BcsS